MPRVYANTMHISSLVALIALLIGAKLLGMVGILISLPVVAALPVVLEFFGVSLTSPPVHEVTPENGQALPGP